MAMLTTRLLLISATGVRGFGSNTRSLAHLASRTFVSTGRANTPPMASTVGTSDGSGGEGIFLFDFDGVVCDSCDECTVSALRTCEELGVLPPDVAVAAPPPWLFNRMREIRPAIEVGWQIPVLLAVFLDQKNKSERPGGPAAMTVAEILENYESLVQNSLDAWGKDARNLIDAFGGVRDAWIADDLGSWLDINAFYPGVPAALESCRGEIVLVTTKQQRFAVALCRHAGVGPAALPDGRIYGLGMYGSKADVVADRMEQGGHAAEDTHFFEDRWPTLAKCLKDERLSGVRFYLCSWGYCTPAELELANAEPRVDVIDLEDFATIVSK